MFCLLKSKDVIYNRIAQILTKRFFITVRDLQSYFGFEEPRAIYKWQKGESLPTVDNLYALGKLFEVPMDQILIPATVKLHTFGEQQAEPCCSSLLNTLLLYYIICLISCH